jgi:Xaa-Pro aminopeptidase
VTKSSPAQHPVVSPAEYVDRQNRTARYFADAGYDGVLVAGRSAGSLDAIANTYWLSHQYFVPPIITPTGLWNAYGCDFLLGTSDGRWALVATGVSQNVFVEDVRTALTGEELLVDTIAEFGLSNAKLALAGSEALPWTTGARIAREYPQLSLIPEDVAMARLRTTLSEQECEMVRHSTSVGVEILRAVLAAADVGSTDGDLVSAGWNAAASHAKTQHWNFIISGRNSALYSAEGLPSWDSVSRFQAGDLIHPDCYGYVDGYMYDLQRSMVIGGKPDAKQNRLIHGVAEHISSIGTSLYDGITPRQVYDIGNAKMKAAGYDHSPFFRTYAPKETHHWGHGFASGFDWPWLGATAPGADEPLIAPFAVAVEFWWGDRDVGAAHHEDDFLAAYYEDDFLVLPDRVENLTAGLTPIP